MKLGVTLDILNQKDTPAFYADTLANRPAAGFTGRVFISTDTFDLYRDNGSTWDLLSPANAGTITGSGAAGQVAYFDAASNITGTNNLFWDSTNNRLGINTNTAGAALDIHSTQSTILQINQTSLNDTRIAFQLSGSALWRLGNYYNGGANDFELFDVIAAQAPLTIKKTTGQVLIGTNIVGAGKLVVASAFGDNGVQIVGATSPSLRIDNAASGATKRAGLGIATNTNNFIQGSADRDFCIFNGSTTAASPMLFGIYDAGLTNVQEAARISAARNFLIGTKTDAGFKLDVNGTSIFRQTSTFSTTPIMNSINDAGNNFVINRANSAGFVQLNGGFGVNIRADKSVASGGTESVQLAGNCTIIGTTLLTPNASAQLQVDSTIRGFLPPRMTTAQKNLIGTPATGLVVYDTTLNKLAVYTGATWETITSV
jgi:hypothetical protein